MSTEAVAVRAERSWSPQQVAIFHHFATQRGSLVVVARAGSGKTTTILEGISHADESRILLCAFNKRIATELSSRLTNPRAEARTLHALGFRFVRQQVRGTEVDSNRGWRIAREVAGEQEPREVLEAVAKLAELGKQIVPLSATEPRLVQLAVEFDVLPDADDFPGWTEQRLAAASLRCMRAAVEDDGTCDYADMLYLPLVRNAARSVAGLVVVDEAQDMSPSQLLLAQRACERGGRIVVVGDPCQAIYGFRGADSGALARMRVELEAAELGLTVTYRCPQLVVALAQKLVPDFTAAPTAPAGVVRDLAFDRIVLEAVPGDFVLSRTNAPLARVCLALLRAGKRARIEGRDIAAGLLKLVAKLSRGADDLGEFMRRLGQWQEREVAKAIKAERESRAQFVRDQAETLMALAEESDTIAALEDRLEDLFADRGGPAVVCSTVHKAKGLEADRVFVLHDTLAFGRPLGTAPDEEKNIAYVAFTRAMRELVIVRGL